MPTTAALRPALRSPFLPRLRGPLAPGATTAMQRAIALLRSLGTSAHVWLPGANGTTVASLPSNNYLLSDGSTGYSTVDGVVGLDLDGMGALGSELWSSPTLGAGFTFAGGVLSRSGETLTSNADSGVNLPGDNKTVKISINITAISGQVYVYNGAASYINYTTTGVKEIYLVGSNTAAIPKLRIQGVTTSTFTIQDIVVKEYTGTHLTQATTANKPLVRRGAYNRVWPSTDLTHANWVKPNVMVTSGATDPDGGATAFTLTAIAGNASISRTTGVTTTTGVASIYIKRRTGVGAVSMWVGNAYTAVTVTASWTRVSIAHVISVMYVDLLLATSGDAVDVWHPQAEEGVTTAGDYTPTTATAASNPSAGKYWWSFDGSNDSLLSGNLGITTACTIVIAGVVNKLSVAFLFTETTNGVNLYYDASGTLIFAKDGVGQLVNKPAAIAAGVPFVITARLSGGTAVLRVNGVQVASAATALAFSAVTGARIGTYFNGTSNPANCSLGWVVPIAAALSDADCLTVERLVSSQFPNGPVF